MDTDQFVIFNAKENRTLVFFEKLIKKLDLIIYNKLKQPTSPRSRAISIIKTSLITLNLEFPIL